MPRGGRKVRLDNGYIVTSLPMREPPAGVSLIGDRVVVEIALNQLKGWRLARRP